MSRVGRNQVGRSPSVSIHSMQSYILAQKDVTFGSPGLPPGEGGLNFCIRSTPPRGAPTTFSPQSSDLVFALATLITRSYFIATGVVDMTYFITAGVGIFILLVLSALLTLFIIQLLVLVTLPFLLFLVLMPLLVLHLMVFFFHLTSIHTMVIFRHHNILSMWPRWLCG